MAEEVAPSTISLVHNRLNVTRETELLQSFVGVTTDDGKTPPKHPEIPKEIKTDEAQLHVDKEIKDGDDDKKKDDDSTLTQKLNEEVKKKKKRRKRNGSKHEELYCDKDRAAAANMGSKDIKQSLKLKRKEDRSKILQIPEEAEPGTFMALGHYEMCRGDLQIARDFYKKALELNPAEKSALVARSKCYILLGQPEKALEDAETALNIDKTYLRAIYQKAEALYYLGDFEHSLMYYHRGLHIRPDHEDFKLGVHKAQKAIENAIGSPNVFANLLSPKIQSGRTDKSKASDSTGATETGKSASQRGTTGSRTKSGRQSRLLRELGPDKEYLDNLMKNPNLKCKFKQDDSTIIKTIEETVEYLNARQEFWRQQLPAHLK